MIKLISNPLLSTRRNVNGFVVDIDSLVLGNLHLGNVLYNSFVVDLTMFVVILSKIAAVPKAKPYYEKEPKIFNRDPMFQDQKVLPDVRRRSILLRSY